MPSRTLTTLLVALACGAGALFGQACRGGPNPPLAKKTHLARLPADWRPGSLVFTDQGDAYAFVVTTREGERVVGPGAGDGTYGKIGRPLFAPDTSRLFYWVRERAEDDAIALVAEGTRRAIGVSGRGILEFSADGSRWASIGVGPTKPDGSFGDFWMLVDGKEQGLYRDLSQPTFSRDARHVAVLVADESGRIAVMVDGEKRTPFPAPASPCAVATAKMAEHPDLTGHHRTRYLADGSLLVATRDADGWGVYRDGTRIASYPVSTTDGPASECPLGPVLLVESIRTAKDASVAVWWERLEGHPPRWRVMRNGEPLDDVVCDEFMSSQPPELSADGRHIAYGCPMRQPAGGEKVLVIKDGVRHGPYNQVWGIALSDGDGAHVTFGADEAGGERPWAFYIDGTQVPRKWQAVWRPRLSEGGRHLAWEARILPEGVGYLGLDRRRFGAFDEVLWGPKFENEHVAWVVRRGRRLTRVELPLS